MAAVWIILPGETNIRERKQNKKIYKAIVHPIMTYALEKRAEISKPDKCGRKWDGSTKKNSWQNKNR